MYVPFSHFAINKVILPQVLRIFRWAGPRTQKPPLTRKKVIPHDKKPAVSLQDCRFWIFQMKLLEVSREDYSAQNDETEIHAH